jgi:hypothetical protein
LLKQYVGSKKLAGAYTHTHTHILVAQLAVALGETVLAQDGFSEKGPRKVLELVITCLCMELPRMNEAMLQTLKAVFGVERLDETEDEDDGLSSDVRMYAPRTA